MWYNVCMSTDNMPVFGDVRAKLDQCGLVSNRHDDRPYWDQLVTHFEHEVEGVVSSIKDFNEYGNLEELRIDIATHNKAIVSVQELLILIDSGSERLSEFGKLQSQTAFVAKYCQFETLYQQLEALDVEENQ